MSEPSVVERALAAAATSAAKRGVAATTLEVVAQDSGVSRATLYRHFPRGRQQLLDDLVVHETGRFFAELYGQVQHLATIESVLERGLSYAHDAVGQHYLLQTVLREDPSVLEPGLTVVVSELFPQIASVLAPFLPDDTTKGERADFLARMALDYISTQGRWEFADPTQLHQLVTGELLAWTTVPAKRYLAATVSPLRTVRDDTVRGRVIEQTLKLVASGGGRSFSSTELAKAAGVSRATLYRSFPGGRDGAISAARDREGARLFASVADAMARVDTLQGSLLAGITTLLHHVTNHRALQGFAKSEPEALRRSLRFDEGSRTYYVASSFAQPLLGRWLEPETAGRVAEWLCRVVVSYVLVPAPYLNVSDPASVAHFYSRHLAPGVEKLSTPD